MGSVGPIEAKARANARTLRSKFFPTAAELRAIERQKEQDKRREAIILSFKRLDVINSKTHIPMPTRREQIDAILEEVAERHRVPVAVMKGTRRYKKYVHARQEAMYRISMEVENLSLPQIGRNLGGRDHTTVLHGIRAHKARIGAA